MRAGWKGGKSGSIVCHHVPYDGLGEWVMAAGWGMGVGNRGVGVGWGGGKPD